MFGLGKKKDITEKKLRQWQTSFKVEKIVAVLHTGSPLSRLRAIEVLSEINMGPVKRELLTCMNEQSKPIADKAAEALERMGCTPAERELIQAYRERQA